MNTRTCCGGNTGARPAKAAIPALVASMLMTMFATNAAHAQCTSSYTIDQSTANATVEADDRYGEALAVGDFDGDGTDDLVIGSPREDTGGVVNTGLVTVHYGGLGGLGGAAWSRWTQNSINSTANEAGDLFGSVLATGDVNGDGFDDVLIGMPSEDQGALVDAGRIAVKYGSAAGATSGNSSSSWSQGPLAGNGNGAGDRFGAAVAVGDFDGDGIDDVAISAPQDDLGAQGNITGSGRVVVMYGAGGGLNSANSEAFNQIGVGLANEAGDNFGTSLAAGDFDGDGISDLAIGIPGEDHSGLTNVGQIAVKYGTASGLKAGGYEYFAHTIGGAVDRDYDELGEYLAAGDLNADGTDDLVIGIPSKNVNGDDNAGLAIVMFGGGGGLVTTADSRALMSSNAGVPVVPFVNFGDGVTVNDLDGDGYDDIALGVPRYSGGEGRIAVFFGNSTGTMAADTQWFSEACMGGTAANDQYFGQVLAAGDFDGDGQVELAAGDYNEDSAGVNASGAVFIANISK